MGRIGFMYGDLNKLDEMLEKVNSVSPCFCLAKWMHCTIHLATGKTHSCYLPQTHKIPLAEIQQNPAALHNTSQKIKARKQMKEGERPSECQICWNIEDLPGNHLSDRHYRSIDSWTMPYFDQIKKSSPESFINPSYLEVSFSNACNLKCTYCSPAASHEWTKEIKKSGPYKLHTNIHQDMRYFEENGELPMAEEDNPYIEAFWKWWPELVNSLMYFRITGGEPLLSPNTFKVMDWLKEDPHPSLNLSINSNFSIPEKPYEKFIEGIHSVVEKGHVKEFILHVSLDTFGEDAEYIRDGLDFNLFKNRVEDYLEKVPRGALAIMCTFNNLSLFHFEDFLKWIKELRGKYSNEERDIFLDIPHLQFPKHQSAQILPKKFHPKMQSLIQMMKEDPCFRKGEIQKMERIFEWMQSMREEEKGDFLKDFYLFFKEKDRRRGTNFLKVFPELKEFWELAKKGRVR